MQGQLRDGNPRKVPFDFDERVVDALMQRAQPAGIGPRGQDRIRSIRSIGSMADKASSAVSVSGSRTNTYPPVMPRWADTMPARVSNWSTLIR